MIKPDNNGVALNSMTHPRLSWWKRLLAFFQCSRVSPDAIETVEIPVQKEPSRGFRVNSRPQRLLPPEA